jgi:hypothetical protein
MKYESIPILLFYGNRGDEILAARDRALDAILPRETRHENLTEVYSNQGGSVSLAKALPEISADLDTMSFIPDATKCVIVTNPEELMGSGGRAPKKKKGGDEQQVVDWVTKVLPKTGHHMIVLGMEDESIGREVNEQSALFQAIQQIGYSKRFREVLFFKIEDGLLHRQINVVLGAVRELWNPRGGDMRVYNALTRSIRFMLQANLDKDPRIRRDPNLKSTLLPANKSTNLYKSSPTVQRKYTQITRYRTQDLLEAYESLTKVYQAMRPRADAVYVPDALGILEQTLSRLMMSPDPMSR